MKTENINIKITITTKSELKTLLNTMPEHAFTTCFLLRILPVKHEPTSCVKTPAEIALRFISACIINSCKADVDPEDCSDNLSSHL